MAIQLPDPQVSSTFTANNGVTYSWNGSAWDSFVPGGGNLPGGGGGVAGGLAALGQEGVSISPTPPQTNVVGALWIDSAGGRPDLKLWDGTRWISAVEGIDGIVDKTDASGQRQVLGIGTIDAGLMP
jgi:hypothetical protein